MSGKLKNVTRITYTLALMLCDGGKFCARPIEHLRQSAHIIHITAQISINVQFEHQLGL
jgi:hypothetical protein